MSQWDRNIDSFQRLQTDLGFVQTLRVYNASTTYDPDTGDTSKSYSEVSESPIDAEIVPPSETGRQELPGTEVEADAMIYVENGLPIEWREYGEPSEAATEVAVRNGLGWGDNWGNNWGNRTTRYRVETVTDEQNGLVKIAAVEL